MKFIERLTATRINEQYFSQWDINFHEKISTAQSSLQRFSATRNFYNSTKYSLSFFFKFFLKFLIWNTKSLFLRRTRWRQICQYHFPKIITNCPGARRSRSTEADSPRENYRIAWLAGRAANDKTKGDTIGNSSISRAAIELATNRRPHWQILLFATARDSCWPLEKLLIGSPQNRVPVRKKQDEEDVFTKASRVYHVCVVNHLADSSNYKYDYLRYRIVVARRTPEARQVTRWTCSR